MKKKKEEFFKHFKFYNPLNTVYHQSFLIIRSTKFQFYRVKNIFVYIR